MTITLSVVFIPVALTFVWLLIGYFMTNGDFDIGTPFCTLFTIMLTWIIYFAVT